MEFNSINNNNSGQEEQELTEDKDTAQVKDSKQDSEFDQEDLAEEQEAVTDQQTKGESEEIVEDKTGKPAEERSKTSFFNRGKKAKEDEKDEKIADLTDRLIRKAAEFDNFRKRSEKEKSEMYSIGAKDVVESILPVIDSFERGFDSVTQEDKDDAFVEGMEKVYKQFITCLSEIGVEPIEALGKEFDPNIHNAVMHEEDPEQGDNVIIEEFQKGYTYKNHVVRYSMVKVVN